jgi:hypothetical protein
MKKDNKRYTKHVVKKPPTKDQVTRTLLKTGSEPRCSGKHYIGYHVSTDVLKISSSYLRSPTGGKAYGIPKKVCPLEVVIPTILPYLVLTVILQITAGTMLIHTLNIDNHFILNLTRVNKL